MRSKLRDYLAAILFVFGILIAGGESDYWPWHIPIGLSLFGVSVLLANTNDKEQSNRNNNP